MKPRLVKPLLYGTVVGPCRTWWCTTYVSKSGDPSTGPHLCPSCMARYLRKHSPMRGALTLCEPDREAGALTTLPVRTP